MLWSVIVFAQFPLNLHYGKYKFNLFYRPRVESIWLSIVFNKFADVSIKFNPAYLFNSSDESSVDETFTISKISFFVFFVNKCLINK